MVCTPTQQKTYTVGRGEGWMHIAQRVYGDPSKFTDIAAANGKKTTDTIHPGDVLVIP
jgi:nucleoid-associated protein YgaU